MPASAQRASRSRGFVTSVSEEHRARAFRAARRHSIVVKVLKVCLPVATLGVASLFFIPKQLSFEIGGATASLDAVAIESGNLKMVNPTLSGVHDDYGRYDIRADTATQKVETPNKVVLQDISGTLVSPEDDVTELSAISGLFDTKNKKLTFGEGVTIEGRAGLSVAMRSATVHFTKQLIVSEEPVEMQFRGSQITSDSVRLETGQARATFTGNVKVRLEPQQEADKQ